VLRFSFFDAFFVVENHHAEKLTESSLFTLNTVHIWVL